MGRLPRDSGPKRAGRTLQRQGVFPIKKALNGSCVCIVLLLELGKGLYEREPRLEDVTMLSSSHHITLLGTLFSQLITHAEMAAGPKHPFEPVPNIERRYAQHNGLIRQRWIISSYISQLKIGGS